MKISRKWLEEFIDLKEDTEKLRELFTSMGFPVEEEEVDGDDIIFDLEVTPNRPDCLCHYGIARELAVFLDRDVKPIHEKPEEDGPAVEEQAWVRVEEAQLCPRYVARVVLDVEVKPSPLWLQEKLRKMGLEPINNIVDISNYLLFAYGHPTHVFDLDKLEGRGIVVRKAREGERILCLDGVERELSSQDLVIADEKRPVAIAGVIGGEETGVSWSTKNVLIESAYFNPSTVRRTAKRLGISTDASYRFERGADPEFPPVAADLVAYWIQKLAGGRVAKGRIDVRALSVPAPEIVFSMKRLQERLGLEVEAEFLKRKLERVGWKWEGDGDKVKVIPPSYRRDVSIFEDVVEEAARFAGYNKIPSLLPPVEKPQGLRSPVREAMERVRRELAGAGFSEAINYVFVSQERNSFSDIEKPGIKLKNPISAVSPWLRKGVLLTLLETVSLNLRRGAEGVRFFEIGKAYWMEGEEPKEQWRLALAEAGKVEEKHWSWPSPKYASLFYIKGAVERLVRIFHHRADFRQEDAPYFEPGFSLAVFAGGKRIGWLGVVREELRQDCDIKETVYGAEILLEELLSLPEPPFQFKDLPRFPAIRRDIPFLVPLEVSYAEIEKGLKEAGIDMVESFFLIDEYRGKGIPEGFRSLTISFILRSSERTLTKEEADEIVQSIESFMASKFSARVRGRQV